MNPEESVPISYCAQLDHDSCLFDEGDIWFQQERPISS